MAIRIPKDVHEKEFNKLREEYQSQFGDIEEQGTTVYYSKKELAHTYAHNLLFWSSRLIDDPMKITEMTDVARRAICENSCINLRKYLKEQNIEEEVDNIINNLNTQA